MSSDVKKKPMEEKKEEKGVVKTIPTPIKDKIIKETIKEEDITKNERIKLMREKIVSSTNSIVLEASQMESLIKLFQVLQISDYESDNLDDEQRNVIQNMCNILGINLVFTDDGFCEPVDFSDYEGEDVDCKIMPSTKIVLPDDLLGDLLVTLDGYDRMLSSSVLRIDKNVYKKMASLINTPIETINMVDDYISLLSKIQCYDIDIDKELRDNITDVVEKLRTFVMKYVDEKNLFYSKKFSDIEWEAIELAKKESKKGNRRIEALQRLEKSKKKQGEANNPDDLKDHEDEKETAKDRLKKKKKKKKSKEDDDEDTSKKKKKRSKKKSKDDDDDEDVKKKKKKKKRSKKDDEDEDEDRKSKKSKKDKDKKKKKKSKKDRDDDDEDDKKSRKKKKKKKSKKDKGGEMNYLKIDLEDVKDLVDSILEDYEDDLKDINKKLLKDMEQVSEDLDDEDEEAVTKALALLLIVLHSIKIDKKIRKTIIELTSLGDLDDDEDEDDDDRKSRRKKKSKKSKKSRRKKKDRDDDDEDEDDEEDRKSRKKKKKNKKKKSKRNRDNDEDDEDEKGGKKMSKKMLKKLEGAAKKFKRDLKEADLLDDMKDLISDAEDGDLKSKDIKKFLKNVKSEDKKLYKKLSNVLDKASASKESEEVNADEIASIVKKMVNNHEDVLEDADLLEDAEDIQDKAEDDDVDYEDVKDFIESLEDDKDCRKDMKKLIKKLKAVLDSDDEDEDDDRKSRRKKKNKKSKKSRKSRDRDDDEIDFDEVEEEIEKSDIKDIKKLIKDADLKSKVEDKLLKMLNNEEYEDLFELAEEKSSKLAKKIGKIFRGLARVSSSSDDDEVDYFIGDSDEIEIVYSIDDVESTDEYEDAPDITSKLLKITHEPSAEEFDVPIIVFNRRTVKKDPRFR